MRKVILRITSTVDGVVAPETEAAKVFDFGDEDVWSDHFRSIEKVDAMLLGAGMHEGYLQHWHDTLGNAKAGAHERRYAEIVARVPHFVLSRTLREVAWPNATVLRGGVAGIAELKQQAGGDILMWGGPTAAAAAIEAGVIDEYQLVTHPVIAGRGKGLFDGVTRTRRLTQKDARTLPSGIVILKYAAA